MDYWNGGMLYRTYLNIQHVLYSEQWALRSVLCMHCWLDGWLGRLILHCMNFELWSRPGYTFTLWCMQGNQAPQYVSHLIINCHFSFFTYCMSTIKRCILAWVKVPADSWNFRWEDPLYPNCSRYSIWRRNTP